MKRNRLFKALSLTLVFTLLLSNLILTRGVKAVENNSVVLLTEGFDNGTTTPTGWQFDGIDTSSTTNFGIKAPSLKFDNLNESITTPALLNPTELSFWIKGLSADDNSSMLVYMYSGENVNKIELVQPLPTTGTNKIFNIDKSVTKVKFVYNKSQGDVLLDDVKITGDAVSATSITLNKTTDTIEIGRTTTLTAVIEPANTTDKEIVWSTDHPDIAKVVNGIVRGYSEGTAIITAEIKGQDLKAECVVTVTKAAGVTPIIDVRADDDSNGTPDLMSIATPFTIEGRVSADFRTLVSKKLTGIFYIQDETAGIAVTGITKALTLGTKIKVTGKVNQKNGETQFTASAIEDTANSTVEAVAPKAMFTGESMLEKSEGLLVKIQGKITKTESGIVYVNDSAIPENEAKVIVGSYVKYDVKAKTFTSTTSTALSVYKIGDTLSITGISSQDATGHKVMIRNASDMTNITEQNNTNARLNKSSIIIKAGKFEHVNLLTNPGNAVVGQVKIKTASPIVTISQEKNNKRLLKVVPVKNPQVTSQKVEIEVVVNGKVCTFTLDVTIDTGKTKGKK